MPRRFKIFQNLAFIGGAGSAGDAISQYSEGRGESKSFEWDIHRTSRIAATSIFVMCPLSIAWNFMAESAFPGHNKKAVLGKLLIQLLCMPPMISAQLISISQMEGKTWKESVSKVKQELLETTAVASCYWPFVGMANSKFVHVSNRPAVGSVAGLFWNVYFSGKANAQLITEEVSNVDILRKVTPIDQILASEKNESSLPLIEKDQPGILRRQKSIISM
mmetsp:Transcript_7639/g.11472  ORF Transcript_7639/g.11472 Transcript_7639/m.11472 type:complete len:220 (+) Transcript_7639:48-707(+)